MSGALRLEFALIEARHLEGLAGEFLALLEHGRDAPDPAMDRLSPSAYPNDPEQAAEFRAATRTDILDRRASDALVVHAALRSLLGTVDAAEESDGVTLDLELSPTDIDPWMRTLSAIRLVLASRLGVDASDDHRPDDAHFGTYDWLGYRLELLVELADRFDQS